MKPYLLSACFVVLLAFNTMAQKLIRAEDVPKHIGGYVALSDVLRNVKVQNATSAYLTLGSGSRKYYATIHLIGKRAVQYALSHRKETVSIVGHIKLVNRKPIVVSKIIIIEVEVEDPPCNCQIGYPDTTKNKEPLIKAKDAYNNIGRNIWVCDTVYRMINSHWAQLFEIDLGSDADYKHLRIVLTPNIRYNLKPIKDGVKGKTICVMGLIEGTKQDPFISVKNTSQLSY